MQSQTLLGKMPRMFKIVRVNVYIAYEKRDKGTIEENHC